MTYPSEAQLIEMERRARWLLDRAVAAMAAAERMEELYDSGPSAAMRPTINAAWDDIERDQAIAFDVLTLVALVRAGSRKAAA